MCYSCDQLILELRKEMLAENQQAWKIYDGLFGTFPSGHV
jgi:hypothetical protein